MQQFTLISSFLFILCINHQCFCLKLNFSPCGGKVLELRLFGCRNDSEPCLMERGIKGRLEVDFEAPFDSDYVYADVSQRTNSFLPVSIPLPIVDRDACTNHGLTCPIVKGKKYNYFYEFYVDPRLPNIKGDYYLTLSSYWGYTIGCVNIPMQMADNQLIVKHDDSLESEGPDQDQQFDNNIDSSEQQHKDFSSTWFHLF
uniref:MD-2-related lipid-recognition domain-containing protein n=2 Tax=Tetranychus urticae TaxID=32264 RepID=T1JYW9_TETUR